MYDMKLLMLSHVAGDESNKTEEAVTQLLQEALESETEGGADHSRHHFMSSHRLVLGHAM